MRPGLRTTIGAGAVLAVGLLALAPPAGADVGDSHGGSHDSSSFSAWAYYAQSQGGSGRVVDNSCVLRLNPTAPAHLEYNVVTFDAGATYTVFLDCVIDGKHVDDRHLIYPPPEEWDWKDTWQVTPAKPEAMIAHAIALVQPTPPAVSTNPGGGVPGLVNMPVYLKLATEPTVQTTFVTDGPLRVTVLAIPTGVTWSTGDGESACNAPAGKDAECAHLYSRSSIDEPHHAYTITATIHYRGGYVVEANGVQVGASGDIGTVVRTSTATLAVTEAQALNDDG